MYLANINSSKSFRILQETNRISNLDQNSELTLQADSNYMLNETYSIELEKLLLHSVKTLDSIYEAIRSLNTTAQLVLDTSTDLNANLSLLSAPEPPPDHISLISNIQSILYGYAIPISAAIGIILNIMGIYFLSRGNRCKEICSLILSNLLIFNTACLILEFLKSIEHHTLWVSALYRGTYRIIVNSGIRFSRISSIFFLISLSRARLATMELTAKQNGSQRTKNERRNPWLKCCFPVVILSGILTLPILLEFKIEYENTGNQKEQILLPSTLRLSPLYSVLYIGVLNLMILGIIPVAYLLYLAYQLHVGRSNKGLTFEYLEESILGILDILQEATPERKNSIRETAAVLKKENEIKMSSSMVRGILLFVAFQALRITTTIGELYVLLDPNKDNEALKEGHGVPIWIDVTCLFSELCAVINSSIVPIIYVYPNLKITLKA